VTRSSMVRPRRLILLGVLLGCVSLGTLFRASPTGAAADPLPARLSDAEFWQLISDFSEPTGAFLSDNFVSNEDTFQRVVPRLTQTIKPGGAYLGVGPDQNFTYIVALEPRVAFIVDIRRQNLLLHLLYKAVIELSADRADFLSRLFSRPRPPGLGPDSTPDALIEAYLTVTLSDELFQQNVRAVREWLIGHHQFPLSSDDLNVLYYVHAAFASGGPDIRYSIPREPRLRFPSYAELIRQADATGRQRSYLATEENFRALKDLEEKNLIVPIVGDFAGGKALRAVGRYLRDHGATVSAFYTSNVEMYLFEDPFAWKRFYANLAALPTDESSTLIRTYNLTNEVRTRTSAVRLATVLDTVSDFLRAVDEGRIQSYSDVIDRSR
jgi:hypothetical protein